MLKFKIRILFSVLCCLLSCPVLAAPPEAAKKLTPRPQAEALAKAEADVGELYGQRLAAARKPAEKAALGRELVKLAGEVGDDGAAQFALLTAARDLGAEARDWPLVMAAIGAAVDRFAHEGPKEAAKQINEGDALRAAAGTASKISDKERLDLLLSAAEWYVRAMRQGKGLQSQIAEKRLLDLYGMILGKQGNAKDIKTLLGTWEIWVRRIQNRAIIDKKLGEWTFSADGTLQTNNGNSAKWSIEQTVVKITWPDNNWETFNLPLNRAGVTGDSWTGQNIIRARKMN